jgi:hypothetical protein
MGEVCSLGQEIVWTSTGQAAADTKRLTLAAGTKTATYSRPRPVAGFGFDFESGRFILPYRTSETSVSGGKYASSSDGRHCACLHRREFDGVDRGGERHLRLYSQVAGRTGLRIKEWRAADI